MQSVLGVVTGLTVLAAASVVGAAPAFLQPNEADSNDSFIYSFTPNTPFGTASYLGVSDATLSGQEHDVRSQFSFDLTGLSMDLGETARIGVWARTSAGTPFGGFTTNPSAAVPVEVDVYQITGPWNENSANWANPPAVNPVPVTSFTVDGIGQYYSFDATALVAAWLAAPATNYGVQLRMEGPVQNTGIDVAAVFDSAGGSVGGPYLEILAVPEPATLGLVVGAGLICMRRRRI